MKKGYTLIELLAALAIGAILITMQLQGTAYAVKTFKDNTKTVRETMYLNECLSYIKQIIKDASNVSVNENEISIFSIDTVGTKEVNNKKIIKKNNDKLIIIYYENGIYKGENTIVKNIRDFNIEIKGRLLFITIRSINGDEQKGCLGISRRE